MTNSEIRYNEFQKKKNLIGPKWASVDTSALSTCSNCVFLKVYILCSLNVKNIPY